MKEPEREITTEEAMRRFAIAQEAYEIVWITQAHYWALWYQEHKN